MYLGGTQSVMRFSSWLNWNFFCGRWWNFVNVGQPTERCVFALITIFHERLFSLMKALQWSDEKWLRPGWGTQQEVAFNVQFGLGHCRLRHSKLWVMCAKLWPPGASSSCSAFVYWRFLTKTFLGLQSALCKRSFCRCIQMLLPLLLKKSSNS